MGSQKYRRGQIWWYSASGSIGDKEDVTHSKVRPMLIVSNDINNRSSDYLLCIPLTTAIKKNLPTHTVCKINGKQSTFLAESMQSCKKDYMNFYLETLDDDLMKQIENNMLIALGIGVSNSSELETTYQQNFIEDNDESDDIEPEDISEPEHKKPGRKPKFTLEDKIRFINDYETHDTEYMLKKYKIKDKKNLQQRVYLIRKNLKG